MYMYILENRGKKCILSYCNVSLKVCFFYFGFKNEYLVVLVFNFKLKFFILYYFRKILIWILVI